MIRSGAGTKDGGSGLKEVSSKEYDCKANMAPNTIIGLLDSLSLIAKLLTFGLGKMTWAYPLGSFFPLGFLMSPNHAPLVDVVCFILFLITLHTPFG